VWFLWIWIVSRITLLLFILYVMRKNELEWKKGIFCFV
jgi:hypothetical protein